MMIGRDVFRLPFGGQKIKQMARSGYRTAENCSILTRTRVWTGEMPAIKTAGVCGIGKDTVIRTARIQKIVEQPVSCTVNRTRSSAGHCIHHGARVPPELGREPGGHDLVLFNAFGALRNQCDKSLPPHSRV